MKYNKVKCLVKPKELLSWKVISWGPNLLIVVLHQKLMSVGLKADLNSLASLYELVKLLLSQFFFKSKQIKQLIAFWLKSSLGLTQNFMLLSTTLSYNIQSILYYANNPKSTLISFVPLPFLLAYWTNIP